MNDPAIRVALRQTTFAEHLTQSGTVLIDELSLWQGATRVDVALVNGILHGFEIKSGTDTLTRLPQQVMIYNSVLDKATLVVAKKHLKRSLDIIPDWWGIELVLPDENGFPSFETIRIPQDNCHIESLYVAQLLWRDETLQFLKELNADKGVRSKPRHVLHRRLAEVATLDQIRTRVRFHLKTRTAWIPDSRPPSNGD